MKIKQGEFQDIIEEIKTLQNTSKKNRIFNGRIGRENSDFPRKK